MASGLPSCRCLSSLLQLALVLSNPFASHPLTPKASIYVILKASLSSRKEAPKDQELQVEALYWALRVALEDQTTPWGPSQLRIALPAPNCRLQEPTKAIPLSNMVAELFSAELSTAEDTFLFGLPNYYHHLSTVSVKFLGYKFKIFTKYVNIFVLLKIHMKISQLIKSVFSLGASATQGDSTTCFR